MSFAYEVLSDPERRREYDEKGVRWVPHGSHGSDGPCPSPALLGVGEKEVFERLDTFLFGENLRRCCNLLLNL